jgi:hypothetical protein
LDRRRRPAGGTPRMAGIKARGLPSCATPLRFAVPATLAYQPEPSMARAFAGTIPSLRTPCFAWAPAQAFRGLGVRRDERPPDTRLIPAHPPDCCLCPAHPAALGRPGQILRGLPVHRANPCATHSLRRLGTFRGLGVRRDERPPDTRLIPAHPPELRLYPLRPCGSRLQRRLVRRTLVFVRLTPLRSRRNWSACCAENAVSGLLSDH